MGCQDLAEEIPGRTRRDHPASPDLRSFVKGVTGRSSSKSYSVKDETSSKFTSFFCEWFNIRTERHYKIASRTSRRYSNRLCLTF